MNDAFKKSAKRYIETLIPINDITLIILRGHLLIEEQLNDILNLSFPNNEKLSKINLTFFEKVVLANALCWKKPNDEIWDYIFALNSLRNDFAHNLESSKRDIKIEELKKMHIDLYDDQKTKDETLILPINQQIILSIGIVMGFLLKFKEDIKINFEFFHTILKNEDRLQN